jgi:hypothetical protein
VVDLADAGLAAMGGVGHLDLADQGSARSTSCTRFPWPIWPIWVW